MLASAGAPDAQNCGVNVATRSSWSRQQLTHLVGELKWNKRRSLRRCRKAHGFVRHAVDHLLPLLLLLLWRQQRAISSLVLILPQHACHSGALRQLSPSRSGVARSEVVQVPIAEKNNGQKVAKRVCKKGRFRLFRNQSRRPCLMRNATHATMQSPCDSPVSTHPNFATAILHNKKS